MNNAKKALYRAHKARNRANKTMRLAMKRRVNTDFNPILAKVKKAYAPLYRKMGREEAMESLKHMSASYRMTAANTYKQLKAGIKLQTK